MKDKVVNKLLEALFSGDKSEEDMVYVQVKFVLEVLLNNLGKLAVVLVFSLVTGSWAETGITFLLISASADMLMDCIPTLNSFVCCGHYFIYGAFPW